MASIIKASIDLNKIPKEKIFVGKKGKYLPITITINDENDQFGNQGPVVVEQTKEERDAKAPKTYLGMLRGYGLMEQMLNQLQEKVLQLQLRQLLKLTTYHSK